MGAFAGLDHEQGVIVSDISPTGREASLVPTESRREELRRKVADSQSELNRQTLPERDPPEGYKALAMDYPFALVLGGLALGAIAGAMLPRSAARKLARGAIAAAGVAGELGMTYGRQALDAAGEVTGGGRDKLGALGERLTDLRDTIGENAGTYGRKAAELAGETATAAAQAAGTAAQTASDAAGEAAGNARDVGLKIARQVIRLTSQLRH